MKFLCFNWAQLTPNDVANNAACKLVQAKRKRKNFLPKKNSANGEPVAAVSRVLLALVLVRVHVLVLRRLRRRRRRRRRLAPPAWTFVVSHFDPDAFAAVQGSLQSKALPCALALRERPRRDLTAVSDCPASTSSVSFTSSAAAAAAFAAAAAAAAFTTSSVAVRCLAPLRHVHVCGVT